MFLYHSRQTLSSMRNAWTHPRNIGSFCNMLSSANETHELSNGDFWFAWLGVAGPPVLPDGSSSVFSLANSRAAAFSFAVCQSHAGCACSRECYRAAAKLSFMALSQSLGMEGKAETVNKWREFDKCSNHLSQHHMSIL